MSASSSKLSSEKGTDAEDFRRFAIAVDKMYVHMEMRFIHLSLDLRLVVTVWHRHKLLFGNSMNIFSAVTGNIIILFNRVIIY